MSDKPKLTPKQKNPPNPKGSPQNLVKYGKPGHKVNPKSLKNLKPPFTKENQPANRGRKKSRIKEFIQETELTYDDVSILAKTILQLDEKEIMLKAADSATPMLIRLFCRYILDDMKNGKAYNIHMLMDRAVGKVSDKLDMTGQLAVKNDFEIVGVEESEIYRKTASADRESPHS